MTVLIVLRNDDLNGVTTFNMTLRDELEQRGHNCEVLLLSSGKLPLFDCYDAIVFNNRQGLEYINSVNVNTDRSMFFVHSLMNKQSLPFEYGSLFLEVFTFSEVGKEYLAKIGYSSAKLIRNAIDVEHFKLSNGLVQVADLRNGYLYIDKFRKAGKVCDYWIRDLTEPTHDIKTLISDCSVVIAYGRHAIEAMAMGKQVIIYGVNGGDGLVTKDNVRELAKTNFSGWSLRTMPSPGQLTEFHVVQELVKISTNNTQEVTKYIRENYSISKNVDMIFGNEINKVG